jgi:hypothetical protein
LLAGLFFCPDVSNAYALFCLFSDMTGAKRSSGEKTRVSQQFGTTENLGPKKFGQCTKSAVVPERTRSRL